jgi:hypothetical protein
VLGHRAGVARPEALPNLYLPLARTLTAHLHDDDSPPPTRGIAMRTAATTLAAAALLAIGGTAGAALSAGRGRAPVSRAAVAPAPVEVRTQVIHRTVHVVRRHIKPKRAAPPAPPPTLAPAPVRPVVAAATPRPARPLRTRSSATGSAGGGEHEHEHEGGGDD